MTNYSKPLNQEEWSAHYNMDILNSVIDGVKTGKVSVWSKELVNICEGNASVLEIGCGTGTSSLWLAKNGKTVTALDYTSSSVSLVKAAAEKLKLENVSVIQADATKDLPFLRKQFDYAFQAGLLEHFETDMQIELLKKWKTYAKRIISLIPNKASIPYRVGKEILEKNEKWEYGLEIPKHSLAEEFTRAGITVEKEYTIGTEWAFGFLPQRHYVRKFFDRLKKDGYDLEDMMQGYLLVTIGKCE